MSNWQVDKPFVESTRVSSRLQHPERVFWDVYGGNFDLEYTELYFNPPLPEEAYESYQVREKSHYVSTKAERL